MLKYFKFIIALLRVYTYFSLWNTVSKIANIKTNVNKIGAKLINISGLSSIFKIRSQEGGT